MFRGLFGKGKKEDAELLQRPVSPGVTQSILSTIGLRAIPPMPQVAQKAFQIATNPHAEMHDFLDLIESDEALTARIIRVANSVFFDRGKPSTTIEESLVVVGLNELRSLLSSSSLSELFPSTLPERSILWIHNVACALTARTLAEKLLPAKKDAAFTAGLMHDIGKLLLLQRVPDVYRGLIKDAELGRESYRDLEAISFPFDHTEVGQVLAEKWNFSAELIHAIRHHHDNWDSFQTAPLTRLVKAADIISHSLQLGGRSSGSLRPQLEPSLRECLVQLRFINETQEEIAISLPILREIHTVFEREYSLYEGKTRL